MCTLQLTPTPLPYTTLFRSSNRNRIFRVNIGVLHLQHSNVHSFALQSIMLSQFFPIQLSGLRLFGLLAAMQIAAIAVARSEEHTSELQSRGHLVCRLLLEKY